MLENYVGISHHLKCDVKERITAVIHKKDELICKKVSIACIIVIKKIDDVN